VASVKIVHYTNKVYSDGTSPIMLQVIQSGKITRKVVAAVKPEQWNDEKKRVYNKKHPNYAQINSQLSDEFNRIERALLMAEGRIVKNIFKSTDDMPTTQPVLTFWGIADLYLKKMQGQSGFTYNACNSVINKFKRFVRNDSLLLRDISSSEVNGYIKHCRKEGNQDSTINLNFKVLRRVSNFGHLNKHDTRPDDLHFFKLPSPGKALKEKLTKEELSKMLLVNLDNHPKTAEARDMFMLAIYLRGMRISDVIQLKRSYINTDRILYRDNKTGKNFDIKLIPDCITIINKYPTNREYLFGFFRWKPNPQLNDDENEQVKVDHIKAITSNINNKLKFIAKEAGIDKTISTHIARHTFAKMAIDKIRDTNVTMDLLGHTNMKVHEAYIRSISQSDQLDSAADDIFS
jgi:integrase/recombinase XerD